MSEFDAMTIVSCQGDADKTVDEGTHERTNKTAQSLRRRTWGWFALVILAVVVVAYLTSGKLGVEKAITRLTFPAGLIWLGLIWFTINTFAQRRFRPAIGLGFALILYTLLGSGLIADSLQDYLESQYPAYQSDVDGKLDVLVVLGGGTVQGPTRAQAGPSGDRVVLAAQLYLRGDVKQLITTGDSYRGIKGKLSGPKEQTLEIWQALGIPTADIETLAGVNTYEEIQSLKKIISRYEGQRVGLLTSANHMPRAMRLARAAGLPDLIPVPADYQGRQGNFALVDLIPRADSLERYARCQHELLAAIVGR